MGQVKSGKKFFSDGTPVPGQQFEYTFDDIGNRTSTRMGGDQNGWNLRPANYSANTLNQYTSRDVPGYVEVNGIALGTSSVTVNSQGAWRKGEYFWNELAVANGVAPVWQNISVSATGETTVSGNVFVPKTQEAFDYDVDGNLTSDGRWIYAWDAENRLATMAAGTLAGPQISLKFEYDPKGRRVRKQVWPNATFTGNPTNDLKFVYDEWNLLAVLNSSSALVQSFAWGLDLSGTEQGAGGVGGLLWVNDAANGTHFPAYDGNGNVAGLVKAADGTVSARYEYGPGEVIRATGPMAKANPFRFSTKYQDDETDLLYYGYRYEKDGRWLSRDPLGEPGFEVLRRRKSGVFGDGPNLYLFVGNAPVNRVDAFGLTRVESTAWFPGSSSDGVVYWMDVDDGQLGTVTLNRITMTEVEAEMRDLVNQLNGFEKRDGCKSRKYEGGFDSKYFAGENQQHQYYLVDGQGPLYADNQINYIGIGLYEAWLCDSLTKAKAIVWLWELGKWHDVPSAGTMHWLEVGYNNYKTIEGNNNPSEQQGRCCRRCNTDSDRRDGSR